MADPSGVPLEQGDGEGGLGAERDASVEGAVIDGREGGGEGDGGEGAAVREGVRHDGGEGGGERDGGERGVVRERNGADGVKGGGERQLRERGAACLCGECKENVTHMAGQRYLGPSPQRQIEVGERGSVEDNLALKAGAALPSTWQHAKAKSPIAVRVAGKLSSCRAVQPSKAEMPM